MQDMPMRGKAAAGLVFLLFSIQTCLVSAWDPTTNICTLDSHCLNEGKCMRGNESKNYRYCKCQEGFSGPRCSKFCPFDCKNGGYCTVTPQGGAIGLEEQIPTYDPADYMCKCFGHFTGRLCETPYTNCGDAERCYNGGLCLVAEDMRHECSCPPGLGGDSCELPVEITESKVTDEGKAAVTVLSILLLLLGVTLGVMLKRQKAPPKFILVEHESEDDYPSMGKNDAAQIGGQVRLNVI